MHADAGAHALPFPGPAKELRLRVVANFLRITMGVISAAVGAELMLRPFATAGIPPAPRIAADSLDGRVVTRRQIEEGVATSRFSVTGARLTGNSPARAGITAVVLGDSYVVAEQVKDAHTMGARLERLARSQGIPVDIRQYGWHGASPAQYLHVARGVRRRWNPVRVFVVLSDNDFDHAALTRDHPRLRLTPNGAIRVIGDPKDTVNARPARSVLGAMIRRRWHIAGNRSARARAERSRAVATSAEDAAESPPDSTEMARMPSAVVGALAKAYGESLTLVYLATVGISGDSAPTLNEQRFLAACARRRVDCASTREAMLAARTNGRMSHGSPTRKVANGHLNATGHAVVAQTMWDRFRGQVSLATASR
jgi:hypothetical protein